MNKTTHTAFPFYPFLIGLYAITFLGMVNVGQITMDGVIWPVIITAAISVVVFLISLLLLRSSHKAALFSAWMMVVITMYGQFFSLIDGKVVFARHRVLMPLLAVLTLVIFAAIWKTRRSLNNLSALLNIVLVFLIVLSGFPIVQYQLRYGNSPIRGGNSATAQAAVSADPNAPDVYYIILDSYQRADVLESVFQYDNSTFINGLRELGFYFPECTYSNYLNTTPSLSSSLNMDYLENMGYTEQTAVDTFDPLLSKLVLESKVLREFKNMGYKLAAFRGYFPPLDLKSADYYYNYQEKEQHGGLIWIHNFEWLYMRTSILRPIIEAYEVNPQSLRFLPTWLTESTTQDGVFLADRQWYLESKYTFRILPTLPDLPGPKFVYAHIYATHPPYVLDEQGNYTPQVVHQSISGYIPAIKYTNKQVLSIVQTILQKSKKKPIIIIQGDHGAFSTGGATHNKVLNAYYFPDGDYSRLYKTITPVNTFRVVLDQFFHRDYPLIEDMLLVKDKGVDSNSQPRRLPATCDAR